MKLPLYYKILLVIVTLTVACGLLLYTTFRNSEAIITDSNYIKSELLIMACSEKLFDDMQDLETSYRGYLLSGDSSYLEPFEQVLTKIDKHKLEFTSSVVNFNRKDIPYLKIDSLINLKVRHGKKIIADKNSGAPSDSIQYQLNTGKIIMNEIRATISAIEEDGRIIFQKSNNEKKTIADKTRKSFTLLGLGLGLTLIIFSIIILRDIRKNESNRKIREDILQNNRYLAQLISQTSDAIISTDNNFIIKSWNLGAEKMYGYTAKESIGQSIRDIIKPISDESTTKNQLNQLLTYGSWEGETIHHRKDGSKLTIYGSVSVIKDEDGSTIGAVAINKDINVLKQYEKELKDLNSELEEKVRIKTEEIIQTFERLDEGFLLLDNDWRITYINNTAVERTGISRENLMGADLRIIQPDIYNYPPHYPAIKYFEKAFQTRQIIEFEEFYSPFNAWLQNRVYPNHSGISIFIRDVTDKKTAEILKQENEKKYRLLFENNPIPMWVYDFESKIIVDVNRAAINHYGYSKEEFYKLSIFQISQINEQNKQNEFISEREDGLRKAENWKHFKKDGTLIDVEILSFEMQYEGRRRIVVISNDVTEKLKAEEQLKNSRDELRNLSTHLQTIREEERTIIAREIHDELGQQLTALKMDISWLLKKVHSEEKLQSKIHSMLSLIDDTVRSVRKIASELRPGILDDLGLLAALEWQSKEFENRTGIKVNFIQQDFNNYLDKNTATAIFRIYQESLTNVARHSEASIVNSSISVNENKLHLAISDNGKGMQYDANSKRTFGLIGMNERARGINGKIEINSIPGKGTEIHLIVNLDLQPFA